jgi:hypothetical protein
MDDSLWTVQDILAERRMANGESEVLVVWKPSWIPKSNMNDDGAVMRAFKEAMKVRFNSIYSGTGLGTLILPVEPGTTLADDCDAMIRAHAEHQSEVLDAAVGILGGSHGGRRVKRTTPISVTKKLAGGISKGDTAAKPHVPTQNP